MILLDLSSFFGRFHPLVIHLPIGFLIIALVMDIPKIRKSWNKNIVIWMLSFISSTIAVFLGLLLEKSGLYIESQLSIHKWSGIFLTLLCGLGWIARSPFFKISDEIRKINNGLVILTLIIVGHYGGSLTHGENYLFENAPEWVKYRLMEKPKKNQFKNISLDSVYVYRDLIQPLFDEKCTSCHNNEILRGGLDMSTSEGLFKGGTSGLAIVQKNLNKSLVFKRIIKEQSDKKFMPPAGIPMTYNEIKLIEWWILEGAHIKTPLSEKNLTTAVRSLLLEDYSLDTRTKPWYERVSLKPLSEEDLKKFEINQLSLRKLSVNNQLLDIRFQGDFITDEALLIMEKYAPYITWLNLSGANVQNETLKVVSKMENITRLYLHKNSLANSDLSILSSLNHLELLNLHSTQINNKVFEIVRKLPSLKKLYIWNTGIKKSEIERQQDLFPNIELIGGIE